MQEHIQSTLLQLEQEHNIKILYAVESGSRAWGFESTDSDWDVRFIYIHPPEWYLSIDDKKDNMEQMLPNDLDLAGWELRKSLKLFRKSNPSLLEWLESPLIYLEHYSTTDQLRQLTKEYFNPKSCMYHYLHMAEGNFRNYLQQELVPVKKYFYVLRPVLACKWIESTQSMAPMEFQKLVDTQVNDPELLEAINQLMVRKKSGEELDKEPRIQIIHEFIENELIHYKKVVKQFGPTSIPDTEKLDQLFRNSLTEAWKES